CSPRCTQRPRRPQRKEWLCGLCVLCVRRLWGAGNRVTASAGPYAKVRRALRRGSPQARHEERFVTSSGPIARLALALTAWSERWIPDAFIFALLATFIVLGGALVATPASLAQTVDAWGRGFWELIPFTLQ